MIRLACDGDHELRRPANWPEPVQIIIIEPISATDPAGYVAHCQWLLAQVVVANLGLPAHILQTTCPGPPPHTELRSDG